jgi:hypothetical protein
VAKLIKNNHLFWITTKQALFFLFFLAPKRVKENVMKLCQNTTFWYEKIQNVFCLGHTSLN